MSSFLYRGIYRKRDISGCLIGSKYVEPTLETRRYTVKISDGHLEKYSSNGLSKVLTASVDSDTYNRALIVKKNTLYYPQLYREMMTTSNPRLSIKLPK